MQNVGLSLQKSKKKKALAARANYQSILRAQADVALEVASRVDDAPKKLKSIWETNDMDTFLTIADERENGYLAERNVRVVVSGAVHIVKNDKVVPHSDDRDWFKLSAQLTIPKRPSWSFDLKAVELERREKSMFLDWRRSLAGLEESHKVLLTPYEKNLEVWRQLWRVVERSDILLEILDCRNPLAFRSQDFEAYAAAAENQHHVSKKVILLLNKADLLTENQRKAWASFFQSRGEMFYFFSAKPLERPLDHTQEKNKDVSSDDDDDAPPNQVEEDLKRLQKNDDDDDESEDALNTDEEEEERFARLQKNKKEKPRHLSRKLNGNPIAYVNPYELVALRQQVKNQKNAPPPPKPTRPETKEERLRTERIAKKIALHRPHDVLAPEDLLDHLATFRAPMGVKDGNVPLVVGMVGYPNVGKSSTINAILGCKKVVVSATPGKTKHFQTLIIPNERRIMLCDCPGLVFPSFASTREQMICDGVLPIDAVRDYVSPIGVVCQRIPRQVFEEYYKVQLLPEYDVDLSTSIADRLLNIVARRRGYMTEHDKPNRSKIAKELLKMYVDGVFIYVHPPPGLVLGIPEEYIPSANDEENWSDEDSEDDNTEDKEEDVWEDISSADEARALSDAGNDDDDDDDEAAEARAAPPMFFARPRGAQMTQTELFNLEHNVAMMAMHHKGPVHRKKRTNHQLDPETGVYVREDGEVELAIDSDDGIVAYDPTKLPRSLLQRKEKKKSKRSTRRETKKLGLSVPTNPTTKVVSFSSV